MKFELPFLPPSINSCYYTDFSTKTRHKSSEYRKFIKKSKLYLPKESIKGEVQIEYNFYFNDKRRRDVCNYEKALSDMLVYYGVIEDDSKIGRMMIEKYKGEPLTVIEIKTLLI